MSADVAAALIALASALVYIGWEVRKSRKAVGEPNGHGDLVSMMTQMLHGQAGQDRRLARLETRMSRAESRLHSIEDEVA